MKQNSLHTFLNLSSNIHDHRDYMMSSFSNFNHHYPPSVSKSHLAPSHSSYLDIHSNRIISALKRDRLRTHNDELPKYSNNSTLFPDTGMSHKRYMAQIQNKLLGSTPKSQNFNLSHSAALYPYSFTEYQRMKVKMQEKSMAQDQWLESELSRMKHEDQLLEAKEKNRKQLQTPYLPLKIQNKKKVKEIFNQLRQNLKPANDKVNQFNLSENKQKNNEIYCMNHSFVQEPPKPTTNDSKNISGSQLMSSDSKSKKSQRHTKHKKVALKQMFSRHLPLNPAPPQLHDKRDRKSEPGDRYRYISDISESDFDNSSLLKSHYLNRYDYLMERPNNRRDKVKTVENEQVSEEMIDRAFVFDAMNECESDFEDEDQKKFRKKQAKYKDSLELTHSKLYRTPEKQNDSAKILANNSNKQSKKSSTKQDRRYNDLLVSLQRKKLHASHANKSYIDPQHILYNSQKHLGSSPGQISSQTNHQSQSKPQQSKAYLPEMQIQNNRSAIEHYPVFSPYSQHKHLPHEYMTASLERRKLPKLYGALGGRKKEADMKQHNVHLKDLIVDEIQKKKIANKQQQHPLNTHEIKHYHLEVIGTVQKQTQNQAIQETSCHRMHPSSHPQLHQKSNLSTSQPTSQTIAKTLKVELQILKQQLQDKNRKVVDLQVQLIQIKSSLHERKEQKEDEATTTKSRIPNQDSRKDVTILKEGISQTEQSSKILLVSGLVREVVKADERLKKKQNQELLKAKNQVKLLQNKLEMQQQAINNLFEDLGMYQKLNDELQNKIKASQREKRLNN